MKFFRERIHSRSDQSRTSSTPVFTVTKIFGVAVFILVVFFFAIHFSPYKDLKKFLSQPVSTRVYDKNGELLQILSLDEGLRREFVPLEKMPEHLAEIFIATEDRRFYKHHGVDIGAIFRATFQNIRERRTVSGASTITMQLARIISPSPRRSIVAKISESWNALRLESRLSKKQILELYLNNVPFGFNSAGVATGSRTFFGTPIERLSTAQIFCLAVIPRRPSYYNPLENPEACAAVAYEVYHSMGTTDKIDSPKSDFLAAAHSAKSFRYPFEMPHYIRWLSSQNIGLYKSPEMHLSVSLSLQREAESLLAQRVSQYSSYRLTNGAVLVIDNRTAQILAWVGSADFSNPANSGQVDGVLAAVQPGSSMKPFLYATALEHGFFPNTILPDVPLEFGFDELYMPQNFNNRFNGPVRFRVALASSLNIPAVYLLNEIGMETYLNKLRKLQFHSLEGSNTGLSLALGGGAVSLFELVQAFSVFPRDGIFVPITPMPAPVVSQVDTMQITNATQTTQQPTQIYERDTARIICDILSDRDARAIGFGYAQTFVTPFPSMFKTGTANQFQNITALGATPHYTVGVWMGNFSGETVIGQTGSSIPAFIVRAILMRLQNGGQESPSFQKPSQYTREKICALSGMKANKYCTGTSTEYISAHDEICTWHTAGGIIYPAEYAQWFRLRNRSGYINDSSSSFQIVSPKNGSVFFYDASLVGKKQNIVIEAVGGNSDVAAVSVDGKTSFTINRPFSFQIPLERGEHLIEIFCGNEAATLQFSVK